MPSFNEVLLMGNVTRDPQLKALPNGSQVADFGLAVNRKYRTAGGEDKEETCFVDCSIFGNQAETLAQYVTKGKPLFVRGRLKYDTWEDKSGGKRSKLTVTVENFQFIGGRDADGSGQEDAPPARQQQSAPAVVKGQKFDPRNKPAAKAGRGPDGPAAPFSSQPEFDPSDIPF